MSDWTQFCGTHAKRQDGFTLLEMLLVVTIISVILGLSVVGWNSMIQKQEQSHFPIALRWLMMEARQKAMTENLPVRISIEWAEGYEAYAKSVSWLQLPCSSEAGPLSQKTCPMDECMGDNLNLNRCIPVSKSEKLVAPPGVRMTGFIPPICFLAGSGRHSRDCRTISSVQTLNIDSYSPVYIDNKYPYYYHMHPLTSYIEMLNCNNSEDAKDVFCAMEIARLDSLSGRKSP